jgi:hypothetical protein
VDSLLPVWMKDLEDLKKMVARCPHCGSLEPQHMAHASTFIVALIEQCRRLRPQARTQAERDASRAEEEGLRDALFDRNHTHQYRDRPPGVFERYAMSLEEGKALIRLACEDVHRITNSNRTQV